MDMLPMTIASDCMIIVRPNHTGMLLMATESHRMLFRSSENMGMLPMATESHCRNLGMLAFAN
jgi:hypothetical protein